MSRRLVFLMGMAWLAMLVAVDAVLVLRPENLQREVDLALENMFRSKVDYASFDGGWPGGIVLTDVRVMDPITEDVVLFSIDQVRIGIDWTGAVLGKNPVEDVRIVRPALSLVWNEQGLLELPSPIRKTQQGPPARLPRIEVDGLELRLVQSPYLVRSDVQITLPRFAVALIPHRGTPWLYQFDVDVGDDQFGDLRAHGRFGAKEVDIEISRRGLAITDRMREVFRQDVIAALSQLQVDGDIEIVGHLVSVPESDADHDGNARFHARVNLAGASVSVPGWPQKVSDLVGTLSYANGRLETRGLTGQFEGSRLSLEGYCAFGDGPPEIELSGDLIGLSVSDAFVDRLAQVEEPGPEIHEQLQQWRVRGPADVKFRLRHDPRLDASAVLAPWVSVSLRGCDFQYDGPRDPETGKRDGFPYSVKNLWGKVELNDRGLQFKELRASQGSLSLEAQATVDYSGEGDASYWAHVLVHGMPIDERLFAALGHPDTASLVKRLRPEGKVGLKVIASQSPFRPESGGVDLHIYPEGLNLTPVDFPYRLEDVQGEVVISKDDTIRSESLTFRHGTGRLSVTGKIGIGSRDGEVDVRIHGEDVALDPDLVSALDELVPDVSETLKSMRARGRVHRLDLRLEALRPDDPLVVDGPIFLEDVSITSPDLGVEIGEISATLDLHHGLRRKILTLRPGATGTVAGERIRAKGGFRLGRDWLLEISSDDFAVDEELLSALGGLLPVSEHRPALEGRARGRIVLSNDGTETSVDGKFSVLDLTVRPSTWEDTRIEGVRCTLTIDDDGVLIEDFQARIPRPAGLEKLPIGSIRPAEAAGSFQDRPAILVSMTRGLIKSMDGRLGIGMSGVELKNVPLERWVLEVLGMSRDERKAFKVPPVSGLMNVRFTSASLRPDRVSLNGGMARLRGVTLGSDGDLYLEEGVVKNLDFTMTEQGAVKFGGDRTEFVATNFRILGIPIPRLDARLSGDGLGARLTDISGVVFGFEHADFDLETATGRQLRTHVVERGYLERDDAVRRTRDQLKALIEDRESFAHRDADLSTLRLYAYEKGYLSLWRAELLDAEQLRQIIEDKRGVTARGVIWGEDTSLEIAWQGAFNLDAHLRQVRIRESVEALGGDPGDVSGTLSTRLRLEGHLDDLATWTGTGWVSANAVNVIQLPLFLNIIQILDIPSWFNSRSRTKIRFEFDIADSLVNLREGGWLKGGPLELDLVSGRITFGGIISARLNAKHRGGIPLISDILNVLPSLLLSGVVVQGPLEDPRVEARSLGLGPERGGSAVGRRPRMKPPKKRL